ncbi:MAG: FHA domain-containing protein [Deltaproteobacteria bacterium]|nr:FHA domain-containing protein [Deltaproteobacteria bacterium]
MISASTAFALTEPFFDRSMAKFLRIDQVTEQGPKQIGKLESGEAYIGREPGTLTGITVDNTAISRQHGLFLRGRNHWLFKDLGSTNGSWLNGKPLKAGQWRVVRSGDVIQLADSVLNINEERGPGFAAPGSSSIAGRTLIVFSGESFHEEYPVPEYGRALVVGGSRGDLVIDGDMAELPTLVVERRGDKICAFGLSKDLKVSINEQDMNDVVALKDSDEIKVGPYTIIYGDPATAEVRPGQRAVAGPAGFGNRPEGTPTGGQVDQTARLSSVRGWANTEPSAVGSPGDGMLTGPKSSPRLPFGQGERDEDPNIEETIAISGSMRRGKGSGYDRHPSTRYTEDEGPSISLQAVEDKVIIIIGLILLISLFGLVVWWVFA